ncbi:hypothetical protein [Pseudomonas protegens]|uniref:hypothetical protein n=1 Tax=Pseudomonas protegens TaxID=380021 RepID=UPI00155DC830|nr:hypothetical protein [Pseudomonas protegens]
MRDLLSRTLFHAAGYARGAIETLRHLGVLSAKEFGLLEQKVMITEADADIEAALAKTWTTKPALAEGPCDAYLH